MAVILTEIEKNLVAGAETMATAWGEVVDSWKVQDIIIVKYLGDTNEYRYHSYRVIDNSHIVDTHRSFYSFEACLTYTIAIKYDGINSRAGEYFCRMVGMDLTKKEYAWER